jgi:aspartyl/asparaginyl-tRNA synthetase
MDIHDALKQKDKVTIQGWVAELRDLKKIRFIILRDGSVEIQVLLKNESDMLKKVFESLTKESYIEVTGTLVDSKVAKLGKEMIPEHIKLVAKSEQPFPLDISGKIDSGLDKRLDWRFLDMRRHDVIKIFRLQSELIRHMCEYLNKNSFTQIFSSKLVDTPTEGGTEYFELKYFDRKAYLAQSPQFYKEMALMTGLNKVFEVGMVYRAEPHHTTRHLCEYASFDLELVCEHLDEVLSTEEELLRHAFEKLKLPFPIKIPRIRFADAKKIVEKMGVKTEEGDLTHDGEKALGDWAKKEHNSEFVFLTHFPSKHKVFYAKREGIDTLSFDLLYKGCEITSGGMREENFEKRAANMKSQNLKPEQFDHMRFFNYGMPPHAGFAIGVERLTQLILNLENIREASLTTRDPTRLTP